MVYLLLHGLQTTKTRQHKNTTLTIDPDITEEYIEIDH
jgi:hypothetical protein